MNGLHIFVRGEPKPKGSMRGFGSKGRAMITNSNPKTRVWQGAITQALQEKWTGAPLDTAVKVTLVFQLLPPKRLPKGRTRPTVIPDIDKLERAVLDALVPIVLRDDALVVSTRCDKVYASESGVIIDVEVME